MYNKGFFHEISFFGTVEIVALPLVIACIVVIAIIRKSRSSGAASQEFSESQLLTERNNTRLNKYFNRFLIFKFLGVVAFAFVYIELYGSGDTMMYFHSARAMANVLYENPENYLELLFSEASNRNFTTLFSAETGRPYYYLYMEPKTCMVMKLTSPFVALSGGSYLITSILLGVFSFIGSWKVFIVLTEVYPKYVKQLFVPCLLMPSVIFWSSGILKDNFTFTGLCFFVYGFYRFMISRPRRRNGFLYMVFGGFLILTIKPYVFFGLLPACLIWNYHKRLVSLKGFFIKLAVVPLLIAATIGFSFLFFQVFGSAFAKFNVNEALNTAAVTQNDLKQDHYGGQAFDIGVFDGSPESAVKLMPDAVIAGIFRPFIFEVRSPLMLLSALENLYLIFLLLWVLRYTVNPIRIIKTISKEPIVLSFLIFTILFAFLIGLSTSNFGALVRFKIPLIPFYATGMVILRLKLKEAAMAKPKRLVVRQQHAFE